MYLTNHLCDVRSETTALADRRVRQRTESRNNSVYTAFRFRNIVKRTRPTFGNTLWRRRKTRPQRTTTRRRTCTACSVTRRLRLQVTMIVGILLQVSVVRLCRFLHILYNSWQGTYTGRTYTVAVTACHSRCVGTTCVRTLPACNGFPPMYICVDHKTGQVPQRYQYERHMITSPSGTLDTCKPITVGYVRVAERIVNITATTTRTTSIILFFFGFFNLFTLTCTFGVTFTFAFSAGTYRLHIVTQIRFRFRVNAKDNVFYVSVTRAVATTRCRRPVCLIVVRW